MTLTAEYDQFIKELVSPLKAHSLDLREGSSNMNKLRILSFAFVCGVLCAPELASAEQGAGPITKPGTYVVSESFTALPPEFGPFQASFTGRFTFNPNGTGLCSALLCPPGVIPEFTNVSVSGTATNITPWGPNVHGQIALVEFGNTLDFVNFNGFSAPSSSESDLILTLTSPLGGSVTNIATSEAEYNIFGGGSVNHGLIRCGAADAVNNATCNGSVVIVGHMGPQIGFVMRNSDSRVVVQSQSSVPEPGTLTLFAVALAGLAIARRRLSRAEQSQSRPGAV